MEVAAAGNVAAVFQAVSNEMSTPKILFCPLDASRHYATNFTTDFSPQNISYFVGLDANETNASSILIGDDNLEVGGVAVKSGVLELSTSTPILWTKTRHHLAGNVAFADGSAWQMVNSQLKGVILKQFEPPSTFTNRFRWAIP
jgi:prepilin-type processing-associated H-X9-DG protein